ncbi:MAG: hypothetical protein SNG38_02090 [Rikenellaceae bacterium]
MKKCFLLLGAVIIFMASCINEKTIVPNGDTMAVQLQIETGETMATRTDAVSRYVVEAFLDDTYTTPAPIFDGENSIETATGLLTLVLDAEEDYYFLMWADNGESYNADDLTAVSLIDGEAMSEAWQGTLTIPNNATEFTHSVTLKRAIAKINFFEINEFCSPELTVDYSAYTAFNVASGEPAGETSDLSVTYIYSDSVSGVLNNEPLYIFAPVEVATVMDLQFTDVDESFSLTNIPIQANYVTNLCGHYTALINSTVIIDRDQDWLLDPVEPEVIKFADPAFEAAVMSVMGKIEGEVVTYDDALSLTSLDVNNQGISDMSGIEYFTNLTQLYCHYNTFSTLDLSTLTKLTDFKCNNNYNLVELTLAEEAKSKIVYLQIQLTTLPEPDLTGFTSMVQLYIFQMEHLTSLDVRPCTKLTKLNLQYNYGMKTLYFNEGQTDSGTWAFYGLTGVTVYYTDSDGHDTEYSSEDSDAPGNIIWVK